ncbi:hypothetical protein CLI64_30270 (plasmid) [Nostoc sp. CENA543]|uniref:hypothetical protein n=1 Tax=Nostoc sp. CENA543 TaxID=1869241 RepID=UPI000CA23F39|nr:hypothetical protein [Nostoc sp. CENA543]AUT04723.1 hypothetical protein CLI64_30270 [Nostoc sp. CENA543]
MEFRLYYRGELHSNGNPLHKHSIRKCIHKQMSELWKQKPLNSYQDLLRKEKDFSYVNFHILQEIGNFTFVPLVNTKMNLIAELDITLLRPEEPGQIVTQGGDIDNRLKTLLDALRMPKNINELPKSSTPDPDENPFFCLLEDDNLITRINIVTDRLLEPVADNSLVVMLIHVHTKVTKAEMYNIGLGV